MSSLLKQIMIGLLIILLLFVLFYSVTMGIVSMRRKQAEIMASKYLKETYNIEMIHVHTSYYISESQYISEFSPENCPKMVFTVTITAKGGMKIWKDNYYEQYFNYMLEDYFKENAICIWGENVYLGAKVEGSIIKKIPNLTEHTTLEESSKILNHHFSLFINIPYYFAPEEEQEEATKILEMIGIIKNSNYMPYKIHISRYTTKTISPNPSSENWLTISIDHLSEIETSEQILKYWNTEMF